MTKEPLDFLQRNHAAAWIWAQRPVDAADTMAQFRLEFEWDGNGEIAWLGFADTLYTIWCNGQPLGVGPIASTIERPFASRWDLAEHARPGRNVLAIQVWTHADRKDCTDYCALEAGLIGWLCAGDTVIPSGEAWLARDAVGYSMPAPDKWFRRFQESRLVLADLRDEPLDWTQPDYKPEPPEWKPARIVHPQDHPQREGLRPCPLQNFTREVLDPPAILDAGWAIGDQAVEFVRDVADRMIAQEHESLLCPPIPVGYPFKQIGETATGRPDPQRLGWDNLQCPVRCPRPESGRDFYLTLDLGRQTNGCLAFTIDTGAECTVDVGYADHLRDRRVDPTVQFNLADRVIVPAGRSDVRLPHDRGCRYLQLSLSSAGKLHAVSWEEHVYPHRRERRFESSDRGLNAIWTATENTIRQVSLSFYTDNARRERQGWIGTELIHTWRGGYAVAADLELVRKQIIDGLECAAYQDGLVPCNALGNTPKEWLRGLDAHDLCVPQTFRDYLLHSDDRGLAPRLLEAAGCMIEHHTNFNARGLKERIGVWCWAGWTFNAATSVVTAHNLLLIEALRATAEIHRYLGQDAEADALTERETPIIEAIFNELIDPYRGVLCQGLDPDGNRVPFCSQQDNARALLLGIVPEEAVERFHRFASGPSGTWPTNRSGWQGATTRGDHIRHHPEQPVVAGSQFDSLVAVDTIAKIESPQAALNYILHNWGAMVDEGEGTLWECWNQHTITAGTSCYSQGWGTAVAYQILQYVLGAQVTGPGGNEIRWKPLRVDIREISASLRTLHGDVILGWSGEDLHWDLPEGVTLHIGHPDGSEETVQGPAT